MMTLEDILKIQSRAKVARQEYDLLVEACDEAIRRVEAGAEISADFIDGYVGATNKSISDLIIVRLQTGPAGVAELLKRLRSAKPDLSTNSLSVTLTRMRKAGTVDNEDGMWYLTNDLA